MPFDEQLRRALETLTDRLRDEIAVALNGLADELVAEAQADRDRAANEAANDARADAERESASRIGDAERAADARLFEAVAAAEAAALQNRRAADLAASERLLNAIRALDRAQSLTEILDALANSAGREAARVGILLVRGATLAGWRFIGSGGFGASFDAAHEIELALDESSGVIGEAVRTGAAASWDTAGALSQPPFDLPEGRERVAVPIPMSGQVVAVLYADQGAADDPARDVAIAWPSTLDVMARHAARSLEALTAVKAARVLTERPDVTAAAPPEARADRQTDEEDAARRYARLLVSEIKLYHGPAVVAGRLERNLAARLGGEIARARALYEQRVPAQVRQRTDYFDAELVRTLANGDRTLLGQTA